MTQLLEDQVLSFALAVEKLRAPFPCRKWQWCINSGEFCGAFYDQDPKTKAIRMSMKNCAEKLRPANIKRGVPPNTPLDALQQRTLRAINGSLNWFASQSRTRHFSSNKYQSTV